MSGTDTPTRRPHRPILLILLVALAARIAWVVVQPFDDVAIDRLPDQRGYLTLAQNLLRGDGLQFIDERFKDQVWAVRMPGYPLFVAAFRANVTLVRIAQALIDTSTVLAIYLLARRWLRHGPSLFAAAAVAVNPFLIYFCGLLLTETLFTAMLAWGMYLLVRGGIAGRWSEVFTWLSGALLLALSIHIRQSAIGLPLVLAIAAAFVNRTVPPAYHRKWPLPVGSTMVLLTVLVLLPWALRNHRVLGTWSVWTTTNGGITLYDGLHPDATGASDQSFVTATPQLAAPRMHELERDAYLRAEAKAFVREHPRRVLELIPVKIARTWSPVPLSEEYRGWKYRAVGLLYSLPLNVLVVLGLWRGRLPRSAKVFLTVPAIYFTAIHALTVGSLRYRVPVEPPMAVVAAAFLERIATDRSSVLSVGTWKRAR